MRNHPPRGNFNCLIFNDVDIIGWLNIPIGGKADAWSAIGGKLFSNIADHRR